MGAAGAEAGPAAPVLIRRRRATATRTRARALAAAAPVVALALLLASLPLGASAAYCQTSTLAGSPTQASGSTNGVGSAATFKAPSMGALSGDGSVLYVADTGNHLLRTVVVASATVTTLAGTPPTGAFADGAGAAARFNSPVALAVNGSGLLVCDRSNYAVRSVTAAGVVTTWVGSRTSAQAFNDGTGTAAGFGGPQGIAVDPFSGFVYVMDGNPILGTQSPTLRLVSPAGVVTTIVSSRTLAKGAVDALGTSATFSTTAKAIVLVNGTAYIADSGNNKIRAVNLTTRAVSTFAGSGTGSDVAGVGTSAAFNGADGMCVDARGTLYVAELNGGTLRAVTTRGASVSTLAFTGAVGFANGACAVATANSPTGVAVDAAGSLYVIDNAYANIRYINVVATPTPLPSVTPSAAAVKSSTVSVARSRSSTAAASASETARASPSGSAAPPPCFAAPGSYCTVLGVSTLCPQGTYGAVAGLSTPACSGLCAAGFFGDTPGQTVPTCSGPCWAGHYCPAGSTTWRGLSQNCGLGNYCPEGSGAPLSCGPQGAVDPVLGPANGPAFIVDTAACRNHCFSGAAGQLSAC